MHCMHCMYQCPRPGRRRNGRTDEVLITVWYGMVLPLGGEGMLVCMRACTCAGLGGAMLGGAVRCGAGLGGAVLVLCGAVLASLSESNEKKR